MPLGEAFEITLAAAKEGAEWAWADFYRDLSGPITGYLASRGGAEPEDLAAETMLQVARNVHTFQGGESEFRSWVFVIAHRRLLDERRARGRRPQAADISDYPERPAGDVEVEAVDLLVTDELKAAMSHLTDDQRDVLSLRIIGNLTLDETARVIGKRVGAIKATQRRALVALRGHLSLEEVSR